MIAMQMTNNVSNAVETYAEHIHRKLRNVGFFDEEGQFDVTEKLCFTLNNLQVKLHTRLTSVNPNQGSPTFLKLVYRLMRRVTSLILTPE